MLQYSPHVEIPSDIREQIVVPPEIERAGAGELYKRLAYEKYLSIDTSITQAELEHVLKSSKWYMETQPVYDGLTFSELKKDEPALYLKQTETGWQPGYDFKKWKTESWKEISEPTFGLLEAAPLIAVSGGKITSLKQAALALSGAVLNLPDVSYWTAEDKAEYLYQKEYGHQKLLKEGKQWDVWFDVQAPAWTNIILPFAAGAILGPALGYISKAGSTLVGPGAGVGAKTLGTVMSYYPYVAGGIFTGMAGGDIAATYAMEEKEIVPPGATLTKTAQYGMIFSSAIAGGYWASRPSTIAAYHKTVQKLGTVKELPGVRSIYGKISRFTETHAMRQTVKDYPFYSWEGQKLPLGSRVKGRLIELFHEPRPKDYFTPVDYRGELLLESRPYGTSKQVTSWEQISGKRPDPFTSYRPTKVWGGYEASWSLYHTTVTTPKLFPFKKPIETPTRTWLIPTKEGIKYVFFKVNKVTKFIF